MIKTNKPRIHSTARDFDVANKELMEVLAKYGCGSKNHMSALSNHEMDILLEYYSQKYDDKSAIDNYLNSLKLFKEAQREKQAESSAQPVIIPKKQSKSRVVDTRPITVDISKLDTEKLEKLAPVVLNDNAAVGKQKIKNNKTTSTPQRNRNERRHEPVKPVTPEPKRKRFSITIPDEISVGELASALSVNASEVIKKLMTLGVMAAVSQYVDFDTASIVADEFGADALKEVIITDEEALFNDIDDESESLVERSPVVVVMGHVDHGKTSLLDAIRKTNVMASEAGGITQHIGAYRVRVGERKITFLDTPGHEAFTSMRLRGAQVTDVAIIVVAADDGVKPQTIEAINHAKIAEVNIIVALNKIDKEGANPDRVMQELTEHGLVPEAWGGDTVFVQISAKKRTNIDSLLEMVLLVSEMKELKANPNRRAKGTVIEAKLDKGRGPVATVLVQNGTLFAGDFIIAGNATGRIRAMTDEFGKKRKKAGPSVPVEIIGLSETPEGGDAFYVVTDERAAKAIAEKRKAQQKESASKSASLVSLSDLYSQIKDGEIKELNVIIKGDVQGSVEALRQSLEKISNEEVRVKVLCGAVGAITESDVALATTSNAIIVGFNVRPDSGARAAAAVNNVDMRMYRVIYECIDEITAATKGLLAPKFKESLIGHAQIRQTFKVSGVGTIAGCHVTDGKIVRNCSVRLVRNGIVVHEGSLNSLKRFKDDVKEVAAGYDCGMGLERFNDLKDGDIFECFVMEEIKND